MEGGVSNLYKRVFLDKMFDGTDRLLTPPDVMNSSFPHFCLADAVDLDYSDIILHKKPFETICSTFTARKSLGSPDIPTFLPQVDDPHPQLE